jgi:hypothetical protein
VPVNEVAAGIEPFYERYAPPEPGEARLRFHRLLDELF